MGTTLQHGIFLPAEGERNCYAGLASNWTILDGVVGGYSAHAANLTIHVTAADKEAWNGKADASALTAHTGNTTIHVTAEDKQAWNEHVADTVKHVTASDKQTWNGKQDALSQTQLDAVNSGIDSSKVQQIATNTSDISSLQSGKANDSDVVHKTGDETVGGEKTFTNALTASRNVTNGEIILQNASYDPKTNGQAGVLTKSFSVNFVTALSDTFGAVSCYGANNRTLLRFTSCYFVDSQTVIEDSVEYTVYSDGTRSFRPRNNNNCLLGESTRKWKEVYATNYYYGSNNVEFSTKFLTTDTAQTVSGAKTFSENLTIYNNDSSKATKNLIIGSSKIQVGDTSTNDLFGINFNAGASYVARVTALKDTSGTQNLQLNVRTKDSSNNLITSMVRLRLYTNGFSSFEADTDNTVSLGSSSAKFKDVNTYLVNGLNPSSLSLPSGNVSDVIDISSYITDLSGYPNNYVAPSNGFISISATGTGLNMFIDGVALGVSLNRATSGNIKHYIPILKNQTVKILVIASSLEYVKFIPCQGNV